MENTEAILVDAQVIDAQPESKSIDVRYTPATIEDNIAALDEYVTKKLSTYEGVVIDPKDYGQIRVAKEIMADLNKLKEPIETERKRVKREYEAPLKAFEARVKGITSKIDDARNSIKRQVDNADAAYKEMRREELYEDYLGCAGPIADVISFDAILDPKWLNRSFGEVKAVNELYEKTQGALQAYNTLKSKSLNHRDKVVKKFADTLDLVAALQLEDELNAEDRRMAEFKAAQEAAEAVRRERVEQEPEPEPQPEPEPVIAHEPPAEQPVCKWHLDLDFVGTRDFALGVKDALLSLGITGAVIKNIGGVE